MSEVTQPNKSESRPRGRTLFGSGSGLLGVKLLNAALGFATVTLFARYLPPENYGLYVLALTVAQFLALPLQMGLPTLLNREIAIAIAEGNPGIVRGVQIWSRRIITIGTLVLGAAIIGIYAIVLAAGWPILQSFSWPIVLLIVVLVPVIAEMKRVMGVLSGFKQVAQGRVPDGIIRPFLLLIAGATGLLFADFTEIELLAAYFSAAVLAAGVGLWLVRRAQPKDTIGVEPQLRSADWLQALGPLTVFSAAITIKTYSDILMLGALADITAVAHYRVAVQIGGVALLIQVVANAVLGPWIAGLHAKGDKSGVQRLAVYGSRLAFSASILFVVLLVFIGEANFVALFGSDYATVYNLAVWLAAGQACGTFFGGTSVILNMTRRERSTARYAISTALFNIVLNIFLIPLWGAMGAIISTILTNLAMQLLAWNKVRTDIGVRSDAFARTHR